MVSEEADLEKFGPTESIKFKIGFIQSTIENSFNEQKLSAFTDEVVKFLIGEIAIEPYSTIYKKLLDETGNFIDRIEETPHVSLFFLSARTSHNIDDDKIKSEENKITSRNEIKNKCILDKFFVLQNEDIKNEYEKNPFRFSIFNVIFFEGTNRFQVNRIWSCGWRYIFQSQKCP